MHETTIYCYLKYGKMLRTSMEKAVRVLWKKDSDQSYKIWDIPLKDHFELVVPSSIKPEASTSGRFRNNFVTFST